jgi:hypothetical protein
MQIVFENLVYFKHNYTFCALLYGTLSNSTHRRQVFGWLGSYFQATILQPRHHPGQRNKPSPLQ